MEPNVAVDLIGPGGGQGEFASYLAGESKLNIGAMRPFVNDKGQVCMTIYMGGDAKDPKNYKTMQVNAKGTLRRDEWKQLDEAVMGIAESRLTGVQYLINAGLTYNLNNAMGTTVLEYHDISDALEAELSMDGVTRGKSDRQNFDSVYLPIPIIHADYQINQRVLENSRRMGNPLDTTMAERAARKIMEKRENMAFTNTSYKFGGGTIYSLINHPDRIHPGGTGTKDIARITDWALSGTTGQTIVNEVLNMKQASIDNYHYGPWVLFIPTDFETKLDEDYAAAKGDNTIRERILNISGIDDVVVVDTLPDNNVCLVQKTPDVVRIVQGLGLQNIQWQEGGGFVNHFKVVTIQVPQVRSDQNNRTGIVHSYVSAT